MRLILEVMSGPFQGRQIEADPGQTVRVGRTPKADVAMEDNFMSGEHFAIECDLRSCRLRDLNSRNGTQLNGEIIIEASLDDGDRVHAGRTDFIVRIDDPLRTVRASPPKQPSVASVVAKSESLPQTPPLREESSKPPAPPVSAASPKQTVSEEPSSSSKEPAPPRASILAPSLVEAPRIPPSPPVTESIPAPTPTSDRKPATMSEPTSRPSPPAPEVISPAAIDTYEAATPEGRLLHILSNQPGSLMALIDATHDAQVLELLRGATEEYQSLYRGDQNPAVAPYLIRLPPRSELLKQMVQKGWGQEWGVYLTCPLSLLELREFFRTSLMVTMPDGMELFSRFYDPRFFRVFLETCTAAEAEKFFGPITSYFMEDERPEILLQFKRSKKGAEKKGHLLAVLG